MKPFRFRLEALLQLRKEEERQASYNYAQARQHREEAQSSLEAARRGLTQLRESIGRTREHPLSGIAQNGFIWSDVAAEQLTGRKAQSLREAIVDEDNAWRSLVECRRQTETLRRLKDRQRERHTHSAQVEEQKLIDEAAMQRHRNAYLSHEAVL